MANEKRLIDANALVEQINEEIDKYYLFVDAFEYLLENAPTIDAVEVVHGRWVDDYDDPRFICEECGKWLLIDDGTAEMNYCPNCGAKMDGDGNG